MLKARPSRQTLLRRHEHCHSARSAAGMGGGVPPLRPVAPEECPHEMARVAAGGAI
jgi:hypothetical protein